MSLLNFAGGQPKYAPNIPGGGGAGGGAGAVPRCISELLTTSCPQNDASGPNCGGRRIEVCVNYPNPNDGGNCGCGSCSPGTGGNGEAVSGLSIPEVGGEYAPVNLADGSVDVSGLSLGGGMGPTCQLRYTNLRTIGGQINTTEDGVGTNWSLNLFGRINDIDGKKLAFILPTCGGQKFWFDIENDGSFTPLYGTNASLVEVGSEYWLMLDGTKIVFDTTSGKILEMVSPGGIVTDFNYDSNDLLEEVITKRQEGSDYIINAFTFSYTSFIGGPGSNYNNAEYITQQSYVGTSSSPASGDYTLQARLKFEYATSLSTDRHVYGNLRKIHRQSADGSGGWETQATQMFVYHTASTATTYPGILKYVIQDAGYQSLANPDTATETQLLDASSAHFEYNSDYMATKADTRGGSQTNSIVYTSNATSPTDEANNWKRKAVLTTADGATKTVYSTHLGADMLIDDSDGTNQWIIYNKFDSDGRLIERCSPEAIDMSGTPYNDSNLDLNVQVNSGSGRIDVIDWYSTTGSGAADGRRESCSIKEGSSGSLILVNKREYTSQTIGSGSSAQTIYPVSKDIVYRSDSGLGDPVETTYSYTWHSGTLQPATVTMSLPDVPSSENGVSHPQSDTKVTELNVLGQVTKSTDAVGTITEYEYDQATLALTEEVRDPTGLNMKTTHQVNIRGRRTRTMGPVHQIEGDSTRQTDWFVKVGPYETRTARGYRDIPTVSFTLMNPVSISKQSDDGTVRDKITAKRGSAVESAGELSDTDSFAQSTWVAWTRSTHDVHGRIQSSRVYTDIPATGEGTAGTNYLETLYGYDDMGRQNRMESPDGTIQRSVFNERGLLVSQWVGTDDTGATDSDPTGAGATGNNMVQLSEYEYDGGNEGGNGLRTKMTQMVNATTADNRVTEMEYDWRARLTNTITTDGTNDFHQKLTLDNLGRTGVSETFRDDSGTLTLIAKSEDLFDARGRKYRSKTFAVSDAGVAGNALESNQWYDAAGRVIKSSSPGSTAFTKSVYDKVGRATAVYSAYYDGAGTDDPTSIASNVVLTENLVEYDDASNVLLSTQKDRLHDATGNGSLNGPSGSDPKSRDSYVAMWYDETGRSIAAANYGTNGGSAVTRPSSAPASSDTILVSQTEFDIAGREFETTDPAGSVVRSEFDDAGRTTKIIRNFGGTETETVRMVYNADGQLWKQIAENVDTGDQETVHTYGTTLTDSDVATGSLLRKLAYPDAGEVIYSYDRTGQETSVTDPNGSVHDYSYDDAGRRISDVVSTLGTGVDGAVRRIEYGYDNRMRLENLTSFDATTSGNVTSDVQYGYNDFGQLTSEYQDHGAAVNTMTSPAVHYDYATGGDNTTRMRSITYPDGRLIDYKYGAAGSQTRLLDRVAKIKDGADTLVDYIYSGSGLRVVQSYDEPGVNRTLALGSGSDPYSALDRFGRMIDLRWRKHKASLVRLEYDYDRVGNRLFERNLILDGSSQNPSIDSLLEFDELNRLTSFETGKLNTAGTSISNVSKAQSWTLDETGNFKGFTQTIADAVTQTRTHNKVNEVTNITETAGAAWATPSHDDAGNMTGIPKPSDLTSNYDATWDAWNRLVKLAESSSTVAEYEYDGLNRRIVKKTFASGSLDETRHVYYSLQTQAIEERVDSSTDAEIQFIWNNGYVDDLLLRDRDTTANGTLDERLYSLGDLRFSVVALANTTGAIVERFGYDAHGVSSVTDSVFVSRSSSSYDWEFRYTGRRLDLETRIYFFRARNFHAELGRFTSRDPRGYADGQNLYGGHFVPNLVDPSGATVTCIGLGFEFIFAMGGSYTQGFCWDECGNTAMVALVRVAAGLGGGFTGGLFTLAERCVKDLKESTDGTFGPCDANFGYGPVGAGCDASGNISWTCGPITTSPGGITGSRDIPGFDKLKPRVGGCKLSGSVGTNWVIALSKTDDIDCPCDPEPEFPPIVVGTPCETGRDICDAFCTIAVSNHFGNAKTDESVIAWYLCMEGCADIVVNRKSDPFKEGWDPFGS